MTQKKVKRKHRNRAAPALPTAVALPGSVSKPKSRTGKSRASKALTPAGRLAYAAVGAIGTAALGGVLARYDLRPKVVQGALTTLAGVGVVAGMKRPALQSTSLGAITASGSQLALLMADKRYEDALVQLEKRRKADVALRKQLAEAEVQALAASMAKSDAEKKAAAEKKGELDRKPANAYALPPGALEDAFENARQHMAITADDYADYTAG